MSLMTPDLSYYDVDSRIYTLVHVRDIIYNIKVREGKIVPGRLTTEMAASSHYYR